MTFDFLGSVRLYRDWYEVVIAVVTEEPLAMGVRYSVVVFGRTGPRLFAANSASLDIGLTGGVPCTDCFVGDGERAAAAFGVADRTLLAGRGIGMGFGVSARSNSSSCMACAMALRTAEEAAESTELMTVDPDGLEALGVVGNFFETTDGVPRGVATDEAVGRSTEKVRTESPVADVPVAVELSLRVLIDEAARELASIDNLDGFAGKALDVARLTSDLGLSVEALLVSEGALEGGAS